MGANGRARPRPAKIKRVDTFFQHRAGLVVHRQPLSPTLDWPGWRLAVTAPLPGAVSKGMGKCTCFSAKGIKMKQQEEFPSCRDHTLLKRAAKGGGGPCGEGQCLGCSELQKREAEAGEV